MSEIQDKGRVWLRGHVKPVFAIRVNSKIVIPGGDEEQATCWTSGNGVCVDCHLRDQNVRIARWFPLTGEGDAPGTLFSGFDQTKHADIVAFVSTTPLVKEVKFEGENYLGVKDLSAEAFWELAELGKK